VREDTGNQFLRPPQGKRWIVVDATIENLSDKPTAISSLLMFKMADADGRRYNITLGPELRGQLDGEVERITEGEDKGKLRVIVHGFDYYNTKTGAIESGGADKIAVWLLDTDYDGRSLYPRQVFFPMAGENEGWAKLAKNLRAEIDEDLIEAYRGTVSLPFEAGEHKRIAVKIVDDRGIESLKVLEVG